MKICAVSPRKEATSAEILLFLANQSASLVLLPGSASNTPSPTSVQRILRKGVAVFVEGAGGKMVGQPFLVTHHSIKPMPRQVFARQPSAGDMDALANALEKRTFAIAGRQVTFFICGEIIGFNLDGSAKHSRELRCGDIIANPAHYNMGRWHVLDRRFKTLSRRGAAIHAANNVLETTNSKTDVRIYSRGHQVGVRRVIGNVAWCLEDI